MTRRVPRPACPKIMKTTSSAVVFPARQPAVAGPAGFEAREIPKNNAAEDGNELMGRGKCCHGVDRREFVVCSRRFFPTSHPARITERCAHCAFTNPNHAHMIHRLQIEITHFYLLAPDELIGPGRLEDKNKPMSGSAFLQMGANAAPPLPPGMPPDHGLAQVKIGSRMLRQPGTDRTVCRH